MPLILGTNSIKDTGFNVSNSLRFDDGSSSYLNDTFSTGNRDKWTWSGWVKRNALGANITLFSAWADSNNNSVLTWLDDDAIRYKDKAAGSTQANLYTNRKFRDISAWYHIVLVYDSGNATSGNRIRFYINGVEETSFSSDTMPGQNNDSTVNRNCAHYIGTDDTTGYFFDGYMAQVAFCDGQAYAATDFGEFDEDSGIWKPKNLSALSYGTTGFLLEFKESGTSQNSSGLGADTSGNNNHFAVNNLAAIDQSQDTCTNNFCTLNSLYYHSTTFTYSEGNTKATTGAAWKTAGGTIGMNSGKWYWEFTKSGSYVEVGIGDLKGFAQGGSNYQGLSHTQDTDAIGIYYNSSNGEIYSNNTSGAETNPGSYGASFDTEVIGCALDLDSSQNTVTFYKANSSQGAWNIQDPVEGYTPSFTIYNSNVTVNFGGTQTVALSSAESDENGFGSFEYAPPSGFLAICTKNLAENS